jgi:hypothetical protein
MSRLRLAMLLSLVCLGTAWFAVAQVITSPQVSHLYNTFTNAANYERFAIDWATTPNVLRLATEAAGTGTVRNIALMGGNVGIGTTSPFRTLEVHSGTNENVVFRKGNEIVVGGSGIGLQFLNDAHDALAMAIIDGGPLVLNPSAGNIGIGTVGPNHLIDASLGTLTVQKAGLNITGTWNNAAVSFAALTMNITDSASAAGSLLADLQVGGSSRFRLHKDGRLIMARVVGTIAAPGAGYGLLRWEAGTNPGTLKLVAYSGTSTTGVVIVDNVGGGN